MEIQPRKLRDTENYRRQQRVEAVLYSELNQLGKAVEYFEGYCEVSSFLVMVGRFDLVVVAWFIIPP